jgi:hypothetical protein
VPKPIVSCKACRLAERMQPIRLGLRSGPSMLAPGVAVPVSPPMSAKSSLSFRSRRIGRPRTSRPVGTWRQPTRSPWSAMIRELASAPST